MKCCIYSPSLVSVDDTLEGNVVVSELKADVGTVGVVSLTMLHFG